MQSRCQGEERQRRARSRDFRRMPRREKAATPRWNRGLSDARRQAASLSPSAACRQAGAASHGGDEAAFAKGAGKCFKA